MTIDEMKARKRELGLSNRELSEQTGVPLGTVQKIFGGKTVSPRHETILRLEKVLQKRPENFYGSYYDSKRLFSLRENAAYNIPEKKQGEYTVRDWENLPDDVQAELIDGTIYCMAAPLLIHQELVSILTVDFGMYIRSHHGGCRVLPSPAACRLFRDDKTIVEPDVLVVCRRDQITRRWLDGAPDLAVEILSPSSRKHDLVRKLELYEKAGVREYWIVDPQKRRIIVYNFEDPDIMHIYTFQDKIPVGIWDGKCVIDFAEISKEISYLYDENGKLK